MQRILVTGGAGFIGSHLADALIGRGYRVTILDNLSTGRLENVTGLLAKNDAEFIQGDITDLPLLQRIFRGVDYVFHQAALARVLRSIDDPLTTNKVNVEGTLNVLVAAKETGIKKVIFASSSSVYGGATTFQTEEMPVNPLSPYALTKLAGEYYCNMFSQLYGLSTACLRYFNVYGMRQDPNSKYATAVIAFIGRIAQDRPPVIYGDGEQSRDLTFIEDVVAANVLAMENDAQGIYNIGSGHSVTINQLAKTIITIMGKNLSPIYDEPRPGDPRHTLAYVSKAKNFGYEPKWSLEDGLRKTIEEFRR